MIFLDTSLEQIYLRDIKIIKKEIEPFLFSLEENKVDMFSLTMFLSSYLKELLKEIETKGQREIIIKNILDEEYD